MFDHKTLAGLQLHEPYHFVQEDDPGAVGAKLYWLKVSTGQLKRRNDANDTWLSIGSTTTTFAALTDTPSSFVGVAGKLVAVKADESGLEFVNAPAGGGGGGGDLIHIATITLSVAAASITFSNIPNEFQSLRMIGSWKNSRTDQDFDTTRIRFNGDIAQTNYFCTTQISGGQLLAALIITMI